ncbi:MULTISPECIES: SRPBCC domain-containing protein [Streptomyces]|uniref:SRPBCC domain-containing protein n=1 Tax=Streptomyces TaxID=1883 RepID=UPI00163BFACA|nr:MULTISPECIES: SRPBCC domain-containing protein [Streptomyces]MBC2877891.1 carbon monoxide dehydrogenase subunit G [Streptomyces sp. TYQ1024]UBI38026.1 carbon monoxide dehydrogenase subunit G [Streptomyces mobaraensis]UKW30613.1 carbon monoxide dehydrogenase subunit G [Streptomyces sp. TYQ1024]
MEHEVFVPFPVGDVRRALADPARVVRCVPGLQQDEGGTDDAGGAPANTGITVAGRLRLRIGGSTITYRGSLRLTEHDGAYELSAEGTEARGSASVSLTLSALPEEAPGGTRVACSGTVSRAGRLAEFDTRTAEGTARRLLDRFATALAEELAQDVRDAALRDELPPLDDEAFAPASEVLPAEVLPDDEPPAEAAHARRTMIGRSAEEVDHAPPRGRYAPVPAPETTSGRAALRWAAPAAAVALASAVVVGRVLRRRR